jgi:hypothetical protein
LRSTFSSSRLVRLLDAWAPVEADPAGPDFAERLSLWVNAFDAIGLQSAQQSIQAMRTPAVGKPADGSPARLQAVEQDVHRVRAGLAQAIAQDPDTPGDGHGAYQQRHLDLQRQMDQAIAPLRDRTRQALAKVSPQLRQLAALDAVFQHLLAPREQALLPAAATLMERRFVQLHAQQTPAGPGVEAGDALRDFQRDWRQALLAELDLRLEPVAGLVEALRNELRNRA